MRLFFRDENRKLRVVDTGEMDVDLNEQKALRGWIEKETNIRVKSPILSMYNNDFQDMEPEDGPILA